MRKFGLLGRNIDYSFSRKYFSDKFSKENINAEYVNFDIDNIESFPGILKNNSISGMNVTIPYKESIIPFLDNLDPHASAIQAVNTVKFESNGKLTGHNTDYWGFLAAIGPLLKDHANALILGTGGASKAIAYALKKEKLEYRFVSRNPKPEMFSYRELDKQLLKKYTLIINCTPLGTYPDTDLAPEIPFDHITEKHLIFDLIYNPSETKLMKLCSEKGAKTMNGLKMLEQQAEKAWEIWNT